MRITREFILIPIVLLIFTFLFYNAYGFIYGDLAKVLFPTDDSPVQVAKIYFTGTIAYVILEYFISSRMPNNYFLSRMLGMLTMMSLFIIIYNFYQTSLFNHVIIILSGSFVSFITQGNEKIKYQTLYGFLIFLMVLIYLMVISL